MIAVYVLSAVVVVLAVFGFKAAVAAGNAQAQLEAVLALRPVDLKREVVVHTKNDRSIRGVLVEEDDAHIWIADARYLHEAKEQPLESTERVRIAKSNEDFTQVLAHA